MIRSAHRRRKATCVAVVSVFVGLFATTAAAGTDTTDPAGGSETTGGEASADGLVIGYAGLSSQFPFVADVNAGLEAVAAEAGAELIVLDNEYDPQVVALQRRHPHRSGRANVIIEFQTDVGIASALCEKFDAAGLGDKVIAIDIPARAVRRLLRRQQSARTGEIAGEAAGAPGAKNPVGRGQQARATRPSPVGRARRGPEPMGTSRASRRCSRTSRKDDVIEVDGQGALEPSLAVMQDVLTTLGGETPYPRRRGQRSQRRSVPLRAISGRRSWTTTFLVGGQNATIEGRVEIAQLAGVHRLGRVLPRELRRRPRRARRRLTQR